MRVVLLALLLAACSSDAERQIRQYEIMKRNGATAAERCAKAREVAEAYLAEENELQYQFWDVESGLACNQVALDNLDLSR